MTTFLTLDGDVFLAPRQMAAKIAKEPEFKKREKMLAAVHPDWEPLVKKHLMIRRDRIKYAKTRGG